MKDTVIMGAIVLGGLAGCEFTGKLTRRYQSVKSTKLPADSISQFVGIGAYTIEADKLEPIKLKSVFELSDKAQQEYIKQVSSKEVSSSGLVKSIGLPLETKEIANIEILDYTKFKKRIVISVRNLNYWPADRISKVNVIIEFDSAITLLSCNRLTTEYQTLDLGKISYSNSNSIDLTGNLSSNLASGIGSSDALKQTYPYVANVPSNGITETNQGNTASRNSSRGNGLTAKVAASRSFAEEVMLRQRIVALNASIEKNRLSLFQESISGIDLTGNILADLIFEARDDVRVQRTYSFSNLSTASASPSPASQVKVKDVLIAFPNLISDIQGSISFEAVYRKVNHGDRTISESDDRITLLHGSAEKKNGNSILLRRKDFVPNRWQLEVSSDITHTPAAITNPATAGSGPLIFTSYSDAREFLQWLKSNPNLLPTTGKVGTQGQRLILPLGLPITLANLARLVITPHD